MIADVILYPLVYHVVGYRLKVVRKNLRNSFPEKSKEELKTIEKRFYHHFADLIEQYLEKHSYPVEIYLSKEEELLDTGGGLKNTKKYFSLKENILVHNVDIISQIDISSMQDNLNNSNALAILAVSKRLSSRQLLFNEENLLSIWKDLLF